MSIEDQRYWGLKYSESSSEGWMSGSGVLFSWRGNEYWRSEIVRVEGHWTCFFLLSMSNVSMLLSLLLCWCVLLAVKCQIRAVPEDLRQSLSRMTATASTPSLSSSVTTSEDAPPTSDDRQRETHLPSTEHPYDILTQSEMDLESYVLLLQVWKWHFSCLFWCW